ncbi:hypothetical protein [Streptomyces rochei]
MRQWLIWKLRRARVTPSPSEPTRALSGSRTSARRSPWKRAPRMPGISTRASRRTSPEAGGPGSRSTEWLAEPEPAEVRA